MAQHDYKYLALINRVLREGYVKGDRTGTGTQSVFDATMQFDLSDGSIPLLTTKAIHIPSIIHELLWYITGDTNIKYLKDNNVRIWNEWANEDGDLGPVYGAMLRSYPGANGSVDQLQDTINILKTDPDSRRMVVSYWNPSLLPDAAASHANNVANGKQVLPPCHMTWQLYTHEDVRTHNRVLSLKLTQRSADLFLGVPFNIAQYSILLHMLCHITGYKPGDFIWSGGDVHIYNNLRDKCYTQLERTPKDSPTLSFARQVTDITDFKYEDFVINNYSPDPVIKGIVSV